MFGFCADVIHSFSVTSYFSSWRQRVTFWVNRAFEVSCYAELPGFLRQKIRNSVTWLKWVMHMCTIFSLSLQKLSYSTIMSPDWMTGLTCLSLQQQHVSCCSCIFSERPCVSAHGWQGWPTFIVITDDLSNSSPVRHIHTVSPCRSLDISFLSL